VINSRKTDHLKVCIEKRRRGGRRRIRLDKTAAQGAAELDYKELDTETKIFKKKLKFPLIIESMTGGTKEAEPINKALATIAQEYGLGMGVGSQRAALEERDRVRHIRRQGRRP